MDLKVHKHNDGKGTLTFENVEDCTPVIEHAQNLRSIGATGTSELKHAASFPQIIVDKYILDNNITFKEFCNNPQHVKRLLNDPSLSYFRVWQGKV